MAVAGRNGGAGVVQDETDASILCLSESFGISCILRLPRFMV
jgi:hypothetical protein